MNREKLLSLLLDSWHKPVVFVDTDHVIRYLNKAAEKQYEKWGDVVGKSIFDCHNKDSVRIIRKSFERLQQGEQEVLFKSSEKHRIYMRAVRDDRNELGYYERYEPPLGH